MGCGSSKPATLTEPVLPNAPTKATIPPPRSSAPAAQMAHTPSTTSLIPEPEPSAAYKPPQNASAEAPQPAAPVAAAPAEAPAAKPAAAPAHASDTSSRKAVGVKDDNCEAYGLLLCGAGESGKTTFTRQLKLRFLGGFTDTERKQFIATIRGNLIETMQLLLVYLERHQMKVDGELADRATSIADLEAFNCDFTPELCDDLKALWEDPNIVEAFHHKDETPIPDHMEYFFAKIDELVDDKYVPTDEDILRARIRTIGIDAVTFDLEGARIRIYDVGGQKSERSKWEKVMSEVESVIFCVSFAEFDKYMFEEPEVLRIKDALEIFDSISHNPKFAKSPIFLICNKIDIFEKKIRETDKFVTVFPEYAGDPHDPSACAEFLIQQFKNKAGAASDVRPIIPHKIVALESQQVVDSANSICRYISEHFYE